MFKDALSITIREHLEVNSEAEEPIPHGDELTATLSYGFDGSGQHSIYNQRGSSSSMMLSCFNLRTLTDAQSDVDIWNCTEGKGHNSIANNRPLGLCPQPESRDIVNEILNGTDEAPGVPGLNREIEEIQADGIIVILPEPINRTVKVTFTQIKMTQIDQKMKKAITGMQGAHCTLCTYSPEECLDPTRIAIGFPINRTMQQIRDIFEDLGNPETGIIEKSKRRGRDYAGGARPRA